MKKVILGIVVLLALSGCTDAIKAKKVLSQQGYSNINVTGYDLFACGKDDFYATGFRAVKGKKVITGTVCSGLFFKGSTIRFD